MRVIVSRAKDIGGRPYQEDHLIAQKFGRNRFIVSAIMDGHAGHNCSTFLHNQITKCISASMLKSPSEPIGEEQLRSALQSLHVQWEKSKEYDGSGSTLSGLIIDKLRPFNIWFYNLGDSQALMFDHNGIVKHQTAIHDLSIDRQAEIRAKYPSVYISDNILGMKRVHGQQSALNLSGAFGDTADPILKKCLIKEVDINKVSINTADRQLPLTIVLASDGLWDELSHEEVKKTVLDFYERFNKLPPTQRDGLTSTPAGALLNAVKRKGVKKDNVSIIVMLLEQDRKKTKLDLTTTSPILPLLSQS